MTDIKRRPRKQKPDTGYATHADARRNRREFLRLLGRGLMMIPAAGLANACGIGREKETPYELSGDLAPPDTITNPDAITEPDYELAGGAPFDPDQYAEPDFQIAGDDVPVDLYHEPDFVSPGGPIEIDIKPELQDQPDIKEEDWGLDGIIDSPEDIKPEPEDVQEEDYALSGGIGEPIE